MSDRIIFQIRHGGKCLAYIYQNWGMGDGEELELQPGKTWVAVIRNNQLGDCMIGSSEDDKTCVATKKQVKKAKNKNDEWEAEYRATEPQYLAEMATVREENVQKHGGKTKVEVGLP